VCVETFSFFIIYNILEEVISLSCNMAIEYCIGRYVMLCCVCIACYGQMVSIPALYLEYPGFSF
jgi:hypothetical protein